MSDVVNVLVVDVGNTSIKYTAFEAGKVLWQVRDEALDQQTAFRPDAVYLASVRSLEAGEALKNQLQARYSDCAWVDIHSSAEACGVRNAYQEPQRLGVDRWLAVVASYQLFGGDVVVVDAGTAIKVDMVDSSGLHLGGYITPGLAMMEDALLSKTARIRYTAEEKVQANGLPNSTARAVTEGCYEMALGFLERVHKEYKHFTWVVTGGDAKTLLKALGVDMKQELNLVAIGAKLVGDEYLRTRV
ncbi:type III pantothenate kinase [Marinomonas pollencensis]|uniref:Type III pantothenate kinase n=1 Tax=Marinomonas pollencensis TaxID=491954 RepID=A0A3E0DH63_9GAMM|nr:type III pantothenate kinase [Marinomonas pollencensis]REG81141.1 type III pantothenate kinase [Marinomonas pollencensis]